MNRVGTGFVAGVLRAGLGAAPAYADPVTYGSTVCSASAPSRRKAGRRPASRRADTVFDQSPSMYPYLSPPGFWLRCNDFPSAGNFPGHTVASGEAVRDQPTFVDILPTDVAVSLNNVTLTVAG